MLKIVWKSGFDHIFRQFLTYLQNCFLHWNSKSECYNTQIICTKIFIKFLLQDKKWSRLQNPNVVILQQKNFVAQEISSYVHPGICPPKLMFNQTYVYQSICPPEHLSTQVYVHPIIYVYPCICLANHMSFQASVQPSNCPPKHMLPQVYVHSSICSPKQMSTQASVLPSI